MAAHNGDLVRAGIVEAAIRSAGVSVAVETGTFGGDTALWLAARVPEVHTVEIRADYHAAAAERLVGAARCHLGRSQDLIGPLLRDVRGRLGGGAVLVYLDAHWQDEWPLADELRAVAAELADVRRLVLLDDIAVPGRPWFRACAGGGGTPGDPVCGPRTRAGGEPADLAVFGALLAAAAPDEWIVPDYVAEASGWVLGCGSLGAPLPLPPTAPVERRRPS